MEQILITIVWLEVFAVGVLLTHLIGVFKNEPKGAAIGPSSISDAISPSEFFKEAATTISSVEKDFRDYLDKKLDEARTSLQYQDAMQPLFITWGMLGAKETPLRLTDESKEMESSMMRQACASPAVLMAAVLFDSYMYSTVPEEAEKIEASDIDLRDLEGTQEVLLVFLYNKEKSLSRTIPYKKRGELDYWFADQGWEIVPGSSGTFANPFLA